MRERGKKAKTECAKAKRMRACLLGVALGGSLLCAARTEKPFTEGWSFAREGAVFAPVEIPHDWAIAGPFDPAGQACSGKLPWKGAGRYRKTVVLAAKPKGRVFLDFDGVMARATAFVNGQACGRGEYGYLGFRADATPYLMAGTNTIEVACDTKDLFSRWYPGGGMYRKVTWVGTDNLYIADDSIRADTDRIVDGTAHAAVSATLESRTGRDVDAAVTVQILDAAGQTVATAARKVSVPAWGAADFAAELAVPQVKRWEMTRNPYLYTLALTVAGEGFSDKLTRRIGFRTFAFDAEKGFILNGERVQLNGVDLHADLGPLGMAFDKDAARRQLEIMRDMGANALRTSHNPPAPEVLDLCDEMGIFVWDEGFDKWNNTCGRGDEPLEPFVERNLRRLVRRDRLHPSVFAWSIGNEIAVGEATPAGQEHWAGHPSLGTSAERCGRFRLAIRKEDATRPVAIGSCFPEAAYRGDYAPLDLTGWNYRGMYADVKKACPDQPLLYSESASALSEFGFYSDRLPANKTDYATDVFCVDSRDRNAASWSDIPDREFLRMERDTYCAGEFVWTGIDYLGEPAPYAPTGFSDKDSSRSSYFGICDLLAFPKDRYWLYRAHWNPAADTLHAVPAHWNFKPGFRTPVYVYTNAREAELFLNGKSLGRRTKDPKAGSMADYYSILPRYRLVWEDVAWEPGELKVVAYKADGSKAGERTVRTAGEPVRVVLTPEKRYGELCVVKVTLADKDGNFVPGDNRRIRFAATNCEIRAVGNSNPRGYDSFKDTASHPLHFGRAGVYLRVKPGETAQLRAEADGLAPAEASF